MNPGQYREEIEGSVAQLEADVDVFPHQIDAFLKWLTSFAEMRLREREMERLIPPEEWGRVGGDHG